jgi:hypothetical protein
MKLSESAVRHIERCIQDEIALCDSYLVVLKDEQSAVIGLKAGRVAECSLKREGIAHALTELRQRRTQLVATLAGAEGVKVSDLIAARCAGAVDRKRLLNLIEKLRQRVVQVAESSKEFQQMLNVSLGLVNGSLSIVWSATQPVTKGYNAFGTITESIQPAAPRQGSSLGRA